MIFPPSIRRGLIRGLAGLLLFAFAGGLVQARGETAVWSVKGVHNTVYLAGSVHALPKDHAEFPEQLERAYQAAKTIYLEVDLDDLDPYVGVQFMTEHGTLPENQTLKDVVGAEGYTKVAALAASLDVPEEAISRFEPWAAGLVLTQAALSKSGFDPQLGIDMQITGRARKDGKPVEGLETVVDQLSIFDNRSFEEQTRFLLDAANDAPSMDEDLQRLITAWRAGDLRRLEKEFLKERAEAPELYDTLLGARNRAWLPKIEALLDADQDILVVVGTLHFVGRDGLLSLLRQSGHKAVAVPATKH
jgi:uncharacterized protein YbaP (TraB family)